jgi:2'-5' RNA ligase
VARLNDLLAARGFRTEQRRFAAHVTLLRKARPPEAMPPLPEVDWPVEECLLARSAPQTQGPRYEILQRYPLA